MVDGQVVADETSRRIEWLVVTTLREVARDGTGWFTLFVDPSDGRLWERSYPHSEMHGGGPAMLQAISAERATSRVWPKLSTYNMPLQPIAPKRRSG